ncbi:MAG TPA: PQQ-binding-like beta-propeller repeat protein [Nitrososphaerales archaeon]|nr:PQQ-binding-like beta-propeller repeat protein [Nitrososphaerales archaeon]
MQYFAIRHKALIVLILLLAVSTVSSVFSQGELGLNWSSPHYDTANTRFNPQTVINQDNVENLEMRWIYRLPRNPYIGMLEPSEGFQVTPLVVNGILYYSTSFGHIVAVSTLTSRTIWTFDVNVTAALEKPWIINRGIQRSLTYHEGIIYFTSIDCTIYGLNAITGEITIEIPDTCKDIPGNQGRYYGEEAPTIYKNIAIVSPASGFGQGRGYVAAYNLETGELLWRWFTIPPMNPGPKDWAPEWSKGNIDPFPNDWGDADNVVPYGGAVRTDGVVDEETGIIYLGTALPGLVPVGGVHGHPNQAMAPGPNLYSNAIVALKVETGELVWYHQIEPHGVRRQGVYYNIVLSDMDTGNEMKKAIIAGSFQGFVYILDSQTGRPLVEPVAFGAHYNPSNTNLGNNANMTLAQQVGEMFCPGSEGGIAGPIAYADGKIYVATRNDCFEIRARILEIGHEEEDLGEKVEELEGIIEAIEEVDTINEVEMLMDDLIEIVHELEEHAPDEVMNLVGEIEGLVHELEEAGTINEVAAVLEKLKEAVEELEELAGVEHEHEHEEELPAFLYAPLIGWPQNSTLNAIDASTGTILWKFNMSTVYWAAGVTISGGVIYALDFGGILHMVDADTGEEIDRVDFGASGTAGVTIASAANGEMMLFVVTGGEETMRPTDGIITAFALHEDEGAQGFSPLITYASIAVAAISISFAIFILFRKN